MYFISRSLLLKALGWSLVNSLWQMALLWVLYIILTGSGKRFSARAKHNLALVLIGAGTLWFVFTFAESLQHEDLFNNGFAIILLLAGNKFSDTIFAIKKTIDLALPYLSFIYLGTLVVLSMRYLRYFLRIRKIKSSGVQKIKPSLKLFTNVISAQMGIRRKVAVWLSSLVDSPMTIGFLKPIILMPIATINHLTTEQVESILLHELTHIKRNDYFVNLFVTVYSIIFFFNPFARLFMLAIKKEREHSCDDVVMQFQYRPHTYASALLSLEKTRHQHHHLAMAAVGRNNHLLLERIKKITGHAHTVRRYNPGIICFFLFSMIIGFGLMMKPVYQPVVAKMITVGHDGQNRFIVEPVLEKPSSVTAGSKEKSKKQARATDKVENSDDAAVIPEDDIQYANHIEPENQDGETQADDETINTADQKETIAFSTMPPPDAEMPKAAVTNDYPYVPNSSFSFQLTEDSAMISYKLDNVCIVTNKDMKKALTALNGIDWKKIEKTISHSGDHVDMNKLQKEIRKSIALTDVKISSDVTIVINKKDEPKIRENLRGQLITLRNLKVGNPALKNCPENLRVQKTQQHEEVKKQLESMRRAQEMLKKKVLRMIYI